MEYDNIQFGYHSAEIEYVEAPELLTEGFFDCGGWTDELLYGRKFLILGNKGVGKSALIKKIYINKSADKFYSLNDLSDFPFSTFCSTLISEELDRETIIPNSWEWLILIQIIWLYQKDNMREQSNIFDKLIKLLNKIGIFPKDNLNKIWNQIINKKLVFHGPSIDLSPLTGVEYSASMFKIENNYSNVENIPNIEKLITFSRDVIVNQRTENNYYIFFDGLDKAIFSGVETYESIAALISQCYKLNLFFKDNRVPIKIIIACRNDLFNKLPLINSNSLRQTYSISLEWFNDRRDFLNSNLCKLINLRASVSLKRDVKVFEEYFPQTLLLGTKDWISYIFIFYHTRCTPRDLLAALKAFQGRHYESNNVFNIIEIIEGLTDYSRDYFKNEIIDELNGYLTPNEIDQTFSLLISMHQANFNARFFCKRAIDVGISEERALSILRFLFDCGAVSNRFKAYDGEKRHINIFYTPDARLDIRKSIFVHRALWKPFNYS